MKFRSFGRPVLVLAALTSFAGMLISCGGGHTIGYAYVLANPSGGSPTIAAYNVRSDNGAIAQAQTPGYTLTAANANSQMVASAVTPDGLNLYVLFGSPTNYATGAAISTGASSVVHFSIEQDTGDLKQVESQPTGGNDAVALAIDPTGDFLYAVDTYQSAYSASNPGPGQVDVWPLSRGKLGAEASYPVGYGPRGVTQTVLNQNGRFVYVTNSGLNAPASSTACYSTISGFSVGTTGAFTAIDFGAPPEGSCINGGTPYPSPVTSGSGTVYPSLPVGHAPWALTSVVTTSDGTPFVYVTDYTANYVYAFASTTTGSLSLASSGGVSGQAGYATGYFPANIVADPRATHIYVSNYQTGSISAFLITANTGQLSTVNGQPYQTGTGPTCMAIDPGEGKYFYATNYLSGTVSAYTLTGNTGQLTVVPDEPFLISAAGTVNGSFPTCVSVVANGSTPTPGTP